MKKRANELRVQCHECGRVFNFADYINDSDSDKIIAELVLEKCGGDTIICSDCKQLERNVIEKGTFEWVAKGPGKFRLSDLELFSEDGKKAIFKVKSVNEKTITFEAKRSDFKFEE